MRVCKDLSDVDEQNELVRYTNTERMVGFLAPPASLWAILLLYLYGIAPPSVSTASLASVLWILAHLLKHEKISSLAAVNIVCGTFSFAVTVLTFYTGCGVASVKMGYLLLPTMVFLLTNSRSLAVFWCTACFALQGLTVIADLFKPFGICEGAEAHLTPQVATCFFFFFEVGTLWKLLGMTILTDSPKERAMGLLLQERATRASFMATFSHDMRTPLHALLSAVDLVDHSTLDSELRVTFDIISSCARLLRSLLASTFQLSQFENGQEVLPIALAPLSVRAIYDSVVDTIRIKERSGNTQYHKQCYYSFKTEILEEIVLVDLPKLLQALSNIIFNAYKHAEPLEKLRGDIALVSVELAIVDSQKGGEKLAQHCVAAGNRSDAEEYLIFFVEDRGAGVAKEDRAHIFNRYTTASSSSSPHRSSSNDSDIPAGAGLGLHICRLIIMQMGGALGVMGRRDGEQGACFWLTIPFVKTIQDLHEDEQLLTQVDQVMKLRSAIGPTDGGILEIKVGGNKKLSSERESHVVQELEQESRAGKVNETKSSGKARRGKNRKATENLDGLLHGKRIVVVDDNKMNLLVMERQLSVLGSPSVMQFTDAREALAFLTREAVEGAESGCPVLVLCDLHMPQMSGLEFVLALKSSARRHIPCVAVTADVSVISKQLTRDSGFDDFLEKPFTRDDLASCIKRNVSQENMEVSGNNTCSETPSLGEGGGAERSVSSGRL